MCAYRPKSQPWPVCHLCRAGRVVPTIDMATWTGSKRPGLPRSQREQKPKPVQAVPLPDFDGATYEPEHDHSRLARQLAAVKRLMLDGRWRTLAEIGAAVDAPEASVSARLRDLRKRKFGGYVIERQSRYARERGLFEYRLKP